MDKYTEIDEYCLTLQEYCLAMAATKDIVLDKVLVEKWIEDGLYRLAMSHRLPTDILQQEEEICRYPASNWQWFKKFIPFAKPKYRVHHVTEHLTFPKIKVPKNMKSDMRVFFKKQEYVT